MHIAQVRNFSWMFKIDTSLMPDPWDKVIEELENVDSSLLLNVSNNPFDVIEVDIYPIEELQKESPTAEKSAYLVYQEAITPSYCLVSSAKQMYEIVMNTLNNLPFSTKEDAIQNMAQAIHHIRIFK